MIRDSYTLTISECESKRLEMQQERDIFVPGWKTQARLVSPNRYLSETDRRNPTLKRARDIFDNTAGMANRTFVAGMMNGATSRAKPWWGLEPVDVRIKSSTTTRYTHGLVEATNQSFQISNLYRILPQSYTDLGIFSNSAFAMLPHPRYGFYFWYLPIGSYCIATDSEGNVNQFQRDFSMTVRQVVEQFATLKPNGQIDWSNIDPWVRKAYEDRNYHYSVALSNLIIPNPKPLPNSLMSMYSMNFQSYTWIRGMGSNTGSLQASFMNNFRYSNQPMANEIKDFAHETTSPFLSIKGYSYFPVIANRWEVAPGSDYGINGPAEMVIHEIMTLQEEEKYRLEAIAKLVKPPMKAPSSMRRHQSSVLAGSITYVDEQSDGAKYSPVFTVDPKLAELIQSQGEYRAAIRKGFYEDLFLMMNSEEKISHVTAEEIRERASEKLVGIGPALGQLDQDQNAKLIENALILQAKIPGKLPPTPPELRGKLFRPEYISILAQAQKASMLAAQDNFVKFTVDVATATNNPTLLGMVKSENMIRARAEALGIDPDFVSDEEEYANIVKAFQDKAAQNEQMQQQNMASQTAKNLAGAEVNPDNMLGQFQQMQERL